MHANSKLQHPWTKCLPSIAFPHALQPGVRLLLWPGTVQLLQLRLCEAYGMSVTCTTYAGSAADTGNC